MIANEQALSRELLAVSKSRATYEAALENAGKWLVELADNRDEEDERASRRIGFKPAWSNANSAFFRKSRSSLSKLAAPQRRLYSCRFTKRLTSAAGQPSERNREASSVLESVIR